MRYLLVFIISLLHILPARASEWGAESAVGLSTWSNYREISSISDSASSSSGTLSGSRTIMYLGGNAYYERFVLSLAYENYFASEGAFTDQSTASFSSINGFLVQAKYRFFDFGDREHFSWNLGLQTRNVENVTAATGSVNTAEAVSSLAYFVAGFTWEPYLAHFYNYDLTLPVETRLGFSIVGGGEPFYKGIEEGKYLARLSLGL